MQVGHSFGFIFQVFKRLFSAKEFLVIALHAMRIVHISSVHPWKDPRIFLKQCCSLAAQGFDVHLLTPDSLNEVREVFNCIVFGIRIQLSLIKVYWVN